MVSHLGDLGFTGSAISRSPSRRLPAGWLWCLREHALAGRIAVPEAVIHLEVKQHVDAPSSTDLSEFESVNVRGTEEWLDLCSTRGINTFIYFSTIKAVGGGSGLIGENWDLEPTTAYGKSKRSAEELVRAWALKSDRRCAVIIRPAVIYGPGNTANVFSMVRGIDRGQFFLIGRNDNVKSLVSIGNVVAAVAHLLRDPKPGVHVYNLVDRESFSVRQIAEMVATELGRPGPVRSIWPALAWLGAETGELCRRWTGRSLPLTRSRLKAMQETTHFSAEKLMSTGFVHPQTTQEGLREMVAWYLSAKANGFRDIPGQGPRA